MFIYCENERLLKETIIHNEKTIEELREENKKLKTEFEQLKERLREQESQIKKLTKRLDDKDTTELFKKYLIAIQDINHEELLENKLNTML